MAEPRGRLTCHLSDLIRSLPALPQPVTQPAFLFLYLLSVLVLCTSALFYFPYSLPYSLSLSFLLSSQLHPPLFLLSLGCLTLSSLLDIYSLLSSPSLSLFLSLLLTFFSPKTLSSSPWQHAFPWFNTVYFACHKSLHIRAKDCCTTDGYKLLRPLQVIPPANRRAVSLLREDLHGEELLVMPSHAWARVFLQ